MARTARGSGRDNRKKILDTAIAMIGEKGVDKTSLAAIAREAGLSKGTLYYHFASKNDLIFDITDRHMESVTRALFKRIETDRDLTWEGLLTAFFKTLLASEARSRLHLYLVREAISHNGDLKKRFQRTYAGWFEMADDAQARMKGPLLDATARSKFLVALVDGFILQGLLEVDPISVEDIVKLALKVMDL